MLFNSLFEPNYKFYKIKGYRCGVYGKLVTTEIPGKFVSEYQANLKIKTLDDSYKYYVIPEFNWVSIDDIEIGERLYIAHPFYGIVEQLPTTCAIEYNNYDTLWFKIGDSELSFRSCSDAGMYQNSYNDRRTFFSKKEAEHYIKIMSKLPDVIARHIEHEKRVAEKYGF